MHDSSRDLPCYMRNGEPPHPKAKGPGAARRGRSVRTTLRFATGAGLAATVDAGFGVASALAAASAGSARVAGSASAGSGLGAGAAGRGVATVAATRGVATAAGVRGAGTAASLVVGVVLRGDG